MPSQPDVAFLRGVPLFKDIDETLLRALWPSVRERRLKKGEVLFREGAQGGELFVIRSGTIIVSKLVKERVEQVLTRLGPSDIFGEMSLFGDERKRTATIQAETECVLLGLDRQHLNEFMHENPLYAAQFFQQLVSVLIKRLRDSTDLVAEVTRWGLEATGLDIEQRLSG